MLFFLYRTVSFYFLIHLYVYTFLIRSGLRPFFLFTLAPLFLCMGFYPLMFRLLPDGILQDIFERVGLIWLPTMSFLLLVFLTLDFWRLLSTVISWVLPDLSLPHILKKVCLAVYSLGCAVFVFYAAHEAHNPVVRNIELRSNKLNSSLRIVFAADMHIGPQTGQALLRKSVDLALAQHGDCILLGGDILDDALQGTTTDRNELSRLDAPLGVYAVLGNHDAFGDVAGAMAFLESAGIKLLRDETLRLGPILLHGEDDPEARLQNKKASTADDAVAIADSSNSASSENKLFYLLLKHRPDADEESARKYDLQLSGHTHNGQFIFLKALSALLHGHDLAPLPTVVAAETKALIITNGLGFSKTPLRFFVPPEIIVIDILPDW